MGWDVSRAPCRGEYLDLKVSGEQQKGGENCTVMSSMFCTYPQTSSRWRVRSSAGQDRKEQRKEIVKEEGEKT
jgi:hypothetical protein